MKREKYETRGVTAAVIESKIAPTGYAALDAILGKAEAAFFACAEEHALAARDGMLKMSPRERRRASPVKIALSPEIVGEGYLRVTLTTTLDSRGVFREKKTTFFFDSFSSLISKSPKKRKINTSREKL